MPFNHENAFYTAFSRWNDSRKNKFTTNPSKKQHTARFACSMQFMNLPPKSPFVLKDTHNAVWKNWVISIMIINSHAKNDHRATKHIIAHQSARLCTMCEHNNDSIDLKLHVHNVHDHKCMRIDTCSMYGTRNSNRTQNIGVSYRPAQLNKISFVLFLYRCCTKATE